MKRLISLFFKYQAYQRSLKQRRLHSAIMHSFNCLKYHYGLKECFKSYLDNLTITDYEALDLFLKNLSWDEFTLYWPYWSKILRNWEEFQEPRIESEIDVLFIHRKQSGSEWRVACLVLDSVKEYPFNNWVQNAEFNHFLDSGKLYKDTK